MLKLDVTAGKMFGKDSKNCLQVRVYNSEPTKDGTHLSASCIVVSQLIDFIDIKIMNDFFNSSFIPAFEQVSKDVIRRMELEKIEDINKE